MILYSRFQDYYLISKKDAEDFPKIVENLWRAYLEYYVLADYVGRSGYYLCEVYPEPEYEDLHLRNASEAIPDADYHDFMSLSRVQSDNEHSSSVMWWCNAICSSFEYITPFRIFRVGLMEVLELHDLFESKITYDLLHEKMNKTLEPRSLYEAKMTHDIPDVFGPNPEKDEKERIWAEKYLSLFPNESYRKRLMENFIHMQTRDDNFGQIAYCFDKIDAVLRGFAYESYGRKGRVGIRGFRLDEECMKFTGTDDMNDTWFYSTIRKIETYNCSDFFVHLLAEVYRIVRGSYPIWLGRIKNYDFLN